MRSEGEAVFYRIDPSADETEFEEVTADELYSNSQSGFVRKAFASQSERRQDDNKAFTDPDFKIPHSKDYMLVRLYDLYDMEVDLFPEGEKETSIIESQNRYSSFMGESSIISYGYLSTLFFTRKVNKEGYYKYFVKRNGQYHIEHCDDLIPIDRKTWKPLWGLGLSHPWQILLSKIWMKECGGWEEFFESEPFSFLDAFGLPSYSSINYKKEVDFMKTEKATMKDKEQNINSISLNKEKAIIIARSVNSNKLQKVGLVPNQAAFRLMNLNSQTNDMYRVFSGLPCQWVGEHTPVSKSKLNDHYRDKDLDLEHNFLMNQQEVLEYFNKFYVVPSDMSEISFLTSQDSINLRSNGNEGQWLQFESKSSKSGLLSISVEMPKFSRNQKKVYPEIRAILLKKKNAEEIQQGHVRASKIHGVEKDGGDKEGNTYANSMCDKWEEYGIDFMQGYHHNLVFYKSIDQGEYRLFVEVSEPINFNVRFDSHVSISQPELCNPSPQQIREMYEAAFFNISESLGVSLFLTKKRTESITLMDCFQELGFGSIAIKTLEKAEGTIAMRIFPDRLRDFGINIMSCYDSLVKEDIKQNGERGERFLTLESKKGIPEVLVMERTRDRRKQSRIDQQFPPEGTVEFFKVTPIKNR